MRINFIKSKPALIIMSVGIITLTEACEEDGISLCKCRDNYWDPNHKKYGDVTVYEETGGYGGTVVTTRKKMMNVFNNMVSYDDLDEEDKKLRDACKKKYPSKTEVMSADDCD